jgi:hypothetical protein
MSVREAVTTDQAAIVAAVLDYFEGWFDGDTARMDRALHPALAKRSLADDAKSLDETNAQWMIDATGQGVGKAGTRATVASRLRWKTSTARLRR